MEVVAFQFRTKDHEIAVVAPFTVPNLYGSRMINQYESFNIIILVRRDFGKRMRRWVPFGVYLFLKALNRMVRLPVRDFKVAYFLKKGISLFASQASAEIGFIQEKQ